METRINISVHAVAVGLREARPMNYRQEAGPFSDAAGWECAVVNVADTLEYAAHGGLDRAAFYEAAGFEDLFPG
jgi:hypothetical protein